MLLFQIISALLFSLLQSTYATHIETFSDTDCSKSLHSWNGPNGYPSGRCTLTSKDGNFTSFKIIHPDTGCAITIYAKDTSSAPCSGHQIIGEPTTCYNTTWHYYSIDECFSPSSSSSATKASPTKSATISSTHTTPKITHSATPAPDASKANEGTNVGAIAGGTVGGVVFAIALAGLAIFLCIRRPRAKRNGTLRSNPPPSYSENHPIEIAAKEVHLGADPYARAVELPQRSSYVEMSAGGVHELPQDEGEGARELGVKSPTTGSGSPILGGSRSSKE